MTQRMTSFLKRFRKDEDGSATVEFALYFTVLCVIMIAAIEIAYINLRHSMLERSVDLSVREIRLATGEVPSYETVRAQICQDAAILSDCENNLTLEMTEVDPRNFSGMDTSAQCRNADQDPLPQHEFHPGKDNALMLIRACLKYKPMMPTSGIATELNLDGQGYAQLVVTSAFVQEPR